MAIRAMINKTFQTNNKIGKYELGQILGRGGFGEVYLGHHPDLNIPVAIKIMKPHSNDENFEKRFIQEARTAAKVNHPNIVRIFDFKRSEEDDIWYLVMEYVPGGTLMELLKKNPVGIPPEEVIDYMIDVACGMLEAEKHNIIHRDIKPDNIMLTKDGQAKICDLGLAKEIGDEGISITQDGLTIGSAEYISPEQAINAKNADIRSDIYSMGISMYQLLTGKLPFTGNSCYEIIDQHIKEPLPDPRMVNRLLSDSIVAVVTKMCDKMVEMRYQSMADVLADLQAIKRKEPKENLQATILSRSLAGLVPINMASEGNDISGSFDTMETESIEYEARVAALKPSRMRIVGFLGIAIMLIMIACLSLFIGMKLLGINLSDDPSLSDVVDIEKNSEGASGITVISDKDDGQIIQKYEGEILAVNHQPEIQKTFRLSDYNLIFLPVGEGQFDMGSLGSEKGRDKDEQHHHVIITHSFWMAQTELTIQQYLKIEALINPDRVRKGLGNIDPESKLPITDLNKFAVLSFCKKLSSLEHANGRIPKGYTYRLPTEAEWEFACRAGTQTSHFFDHSDSLSDYAWLGTNKKQRVAQKKANPLGFYDLYGNVSEMVFDSYSNFTKDSQTDPFVFDSIMTTVIRGGSSYDDADKLRSASREEISIRGDYEKYSKIGLRLVLAPKQSKEFLKRIQSKIDTMHKDGFDKRPHRDRDRGGPLRGGPRFKTDQRVD